MSEVQQIPREEWPVTWSGSWRHIYVIQEGEGGPVKVGIAANAFWRISDLQVGNFRPLKLIAVFTCEDKANARRIERWAHFQLEESHLAGEWFNEHPEAVVALLKSRCT